MDDLLADLLALRERGGFLAQLDEEALRSLSPRLEELRYRAGELLIRKGVVNEAAYLVLEGRLAVEDREEKDGALASIELEPGDVAGAISSSTGGSPQRDVRCVEACRLAALPREALDYLLEISPDTWRRFHELALERMRRDHMAGHLDRLFGPFGKLLPYVLEELQGETEWLTLRSGETLYHRDEPAENAYIVMTGRLLVAAETADGEETVLSTVLAGETVGEVGLLTGRDRSVTVYAGRDSEVVRLSRRSFELMLERSSRAMFKVSRILVDRLAHRNSEHEPGRNPIRCIGLVPAHPSIDLDEICYSLQETLAEHGPVAVLSSRSVDRELGTPGISLASESEPAHLRLVQWLHEREAACRYLIYQGDREWTPWSERCARQVDRLAVVADSAESPDLRELGPSVTCGAATTGIWHGWRASFRAAPSVWCWEGVVLAASPIWVCSAPWRSWVFRST